MCKLVVINKLVLGNRSLGWEAISLPKGEVVEYTSKQLKDLMSAGGNEIMGLYLPEGSEELQLDVDGFNMRNLMVKSHINSLIPMVQGECVANIFYTVIGTHKEKGNLVYDVVSSRFERTSFSASKIVMLYDIGIINGGIRVNGDNIEVLPDMKEVTSEA